MRTTAIQKLISGAGAFAIVTIFGFTHAAEAKKPPAPAQKTQKVEVVETREAADADAAPDEPNAGQQSNSKSDMATTAKIRRAIVTDRGMSARARNVAIITDGGQVTLRGEVRSKLEKLAVEKKASDIAGDEAVHSELAVGK